jgi:hypothetical protein
MDNYDLIDNKVLSPDELVALFADKYRRNDAIRSLVGGLTATELRRVHLRDAAFGALVKGLEHSNPKVRWWCLQLFDHVGDERCVPHIVPLLEDPVPRVRRHALHALECEACKQSPQAIQAIKCALAQHTAHNATGPHR